MNDIINIQINEQNDVLSVNVDELIDLVSINVQENLDTLTLTINEVGEKGDSGVGGSFLKKQSAENINSYTPIAIINDLAYKLDASNPLHQFAFVGFSTNGTLIGEQCNIQQTGELTLNNWGLIPNQHYLAGANGTLITENNSSTNFTKVIGYATTSNTLQIIKDLITINK